MELQERQVGDCRIYAAAFDGEQGGYVAAVEVHCGGPAPQRAEVVFTNARLSGGHRFADAAAALKHAMDVGHQAIRLREAVAS